MENNFVLYKGCWVSKQLAHHCHYLTPAECFCLLNRGGVFVKIFLTGIAIIRLHSGSL